MNNQAGHLVLAISYIFYAASMNFSVNKAKASKKIDF